MKNHFKKLVLLLTFFTFNAFAQKDNLTLTQHKSLSTVSSAFVQLGGGQSSLGQSYKDDNKMRSDKYFYTGTHSYKTNYRLSEVNELLNPSNGKIERFFDDATVRKLGSDYAVEMKMNTPLVDFEINSTMKYSKVTSGQKTVHTYRFSKFNMVFTDLVIEVMAEDVGGQAKISLRTISAVKGSTMAKLRKVLAVGKFEGTLKDNVKSFKKGMGGI